MSSHASGQYKFDNYNEKLDEVEIVKNEIYENSSTMMSSGGMKSAAVLNNNGGGGAFKVMLLVLLILVVILQLISMGMTAYNMTQSQDTKCACDSNTQTSVGVGTTQTTCNATEMQAYIKQVIQATSCPNDTLQLQQSIQTHNDKIIKAMEGSSHDILQLLQELQAMDVDFQDNTTKTMENTEDSLLHIINTLSNHKDSSISTSSVVDDILIGVNELLDVHNTSSLYDSITPVSCKDIKEKLPNSPSGYYHVNNRDIYCNMDELCGSGGGWTRLAYLDMTDSTVDCPDELQDFTSNGVRMCRSPVFTSAGCTSPVKFPSNGISYSEICGRVIGYQLGSPDAVATTHGPISVHNNLNSYYVDGISLTRGTPRQHVWTFMCGLHESYYSQYTCPCNTPPGSSQQVQSFVGSHYFCESGNPATTYSWSSTVPYTSDPLWDGEGCGSQEGECCSAPGLPWFHRQYTNTTTDSMDMRICGDQGSEDTPVSFYEIFVK